MIIRKAANNKTEMDISIHKDPQMGNKRCQKSVFTRIEYQLLQTDCSFTDAT